MNRIDLFPKAALTSLLLAAFLAFATFAHGQARDPSAADQLREEIGQRIEAVEASESIDEELARALLDLYRRSLLNIDQERIERAAAETLLHTGERANEEIENTQKTIAELRNAPDTDQAAARVESADLESALDEAREALYEADSRLSDLRTSYSDMLTRPEAAREQLDESRAGREKARAEPTEKTFPDDPPELNEARQWYGQTLDARYDAEIDRLEKELLTHDSRLALLAVETELAALEADLAREQVRRIEAELGARSSAEAEQASRAALETGQALSGQNPLIERLAVENIELGAALTQRVEEIRDATDRRDAVQRDLAWLAEELTATQAKLAIAGLKQALGQLLLDQKRELPNPAILKKETRAREAQVARAGLEQIERSEQLSETVNREAFLASLAESLPAEEYRAIQAELEALVDRRADLLDKLLEADTRYLGVLGELDLAARQLTSDVIDYRDFLDSKLIWVRNTPPVGTSAVFTMLSDIERLFATENWSQVARDTQSLFAESPLLMLLLVLLLVLGLMRRTFVLRIDACSENVGRIQHDRFADSIRALVYTVLAAAPLPLLVAVFGTSLANDNEASTFTYAVALSLARAGFFLMQFQVLYDSCREKGLLLVHCDWSGSTVSRLRTEIRWFRVVMPAFLIVADLNFYLDSGGALGGLTVLGALASIGTLAVFVWRILTPAGGVLRNYLQWHPNGVLAKTRPIWLTALVLFLPALVALWLSGFSYTTDLFLRSAMRSLWLVLILSILHSLLIRWLMLSYRRIEWKAALERRDAELAVRARDNESSSGEESDYEFEEPEVDIAGLSKDSLALLRAFFIVLGLVFLWFAIWAPIVPAFGMFQDITVWTRSDIVDGTTTLLPVSLADLLLAAFVAIATYASVRGLPSLLELLLLHRTKMTAGGRYTATTLLRYTIIGIGAVAFFNIVGVSWSKAQWLIAALGVGIGFGLQEIVANFISGIVILFERPIRVGDVVTVGETSGVVTRIQIRATTIRDWDRRELLVPNKEFITSRLLNWSLSDDLTRLTIPVGIAYGSDVMLAMKLTEEEARNHPEVLEDPSPFVIFEGFGDNALNLGLRVYLASMENRLRVKSELNAALNARFAEAGIVIAFPQRDVHLDTRRPLEVRLRNDDPSD